MNNVEELHPKHVLDHYEDPYHRGPCERPTHADEKRDPASGDTIRIEMRINDADTIEDIWFDGDGSCISQAAASMLVEQMDGKSVDHVRGFTSEQMLELFGSRLTPDQQECCLLPWRVLHAAIFTAIDVDDHTDVPTFNGPDLGDES